MTRYDVIVIGGGTSGLMAAINAAEQGANVLILEKNPKLGRKLLLSGGGRCNVTNRTDRQSLIQHIPGNGKFLYSALNQFDQEDIIDFFESRGIQLKEEDHGRMFPVTNKARTILETLLETALQLNVQIQTNVSVKTFILDKEIHRAEGVVLQSGDTYYAKAFIIAVGGRAYPRTGATGDGYAWAKSMGHTIERLYPTEAPLISTDSFIIDKTLQGLSLQDVAVSVLDEKNTPFVTHRMDMIFTHFGYSGPAILRCSGHVNQWLHQNNASICNLNIDLCPDESIESIQSQCEAQRNRQLLTLMKQWMPERMATLIIQLADLNVTTLYKQLTPKEQHTLFQLMKHFSITATGSQPIEKGFVTGGGVSTKEIEPRSMASKFYPNVFFCGEIIDINGYTGGYNITAAFVTGTIAGRYAAWEALANI